MAEFPPLDESTADPAPWPLLARWIQEADLANLYEPSAMTLATIDAQGAPSARVVLLRGFDERGFTFYTNYQSRKADELAQNPRVALVLFWAELERQVRIEGNAEKVSAAESDSYFKSRPIGHQLGAHVSPQSAVVSGRQWLEERMAELAAKFAGKEVPRPEHWGGYRVVPHTIEFWQGRPNRLHDRLRYRLLPAGAWQLERLAP